MVQASAKYVLHTEADFLLRTLNSRVELSEMKSVPTAVLQPWSTRKQSSDTLDSDPDQGFWPPSQAESCPPLPQHPTPLT